MADAEDRTLPATEQRRRQAREEGQVPLSRELVNLASLAAAGAAVAWGAPALLGEWSARLHAMLAAPAEGAAGPALHQAGLALLLAAGPVLALTLAAAALAVLGQTGGLVRAAALMPDLSRLDPRRGLRRILGAEGAAEVIKSLAKAGILAWALWQGMAGLLPDAASLLALPPAAVLDRLAAAIQHLLLIVLGCQAAVAAADLAWTHRRHNARLRMSRQDVADEHKQSEGDPAHKAKLRAMRRARAKRRMMAAVPKATVVVTNPTHYAVALAYERGGQGAPRVVAKGMDEVAARIRALAAEHRVPLVANPPLARALHQLDVDAEVPAEHFKAVAEIIAWVWRLRGGMPGTR